MGRYRIYLERRKTIVSKIRPELSSKNKYWISKNKYYELKYFCLQYYEWKNIYDCLDEGRLPSIRKVGDNSDVSRPTEELAIAKTLYFERMKLIENTAREADDELHSYIFKAVTQDLSFTYLSTVLNIPCSRGTYYDRYRRFFWLLSKKR